MFRELRPWLKRGSDRLRVASLQAALKEQRLDSTYEQLRKIVPDITQQYSTYAVDTQLIELETRGLQAFQVRLAEEAMRIAHAAGAPSRLTLIDIGDSSGTHIEYLRALHGEVRSLSVNVDAEAVAKIKARGLEAVHASAEEVERYDIKPDVLLCFETLEHLPDPSNFLSRLAKVTSARTFALTVPYVRRSRVGLRYIRRGLPEVAGPETTHIFELSPADWRPLFMFSGWRVVAERVFKLYPRIHPMVVTRPLWQAVDFEGFYGAILSPDETWREQYAARAGRAV